MKDNHWPLLLVIVAAIAGLLIPVSAPASAPSDEARALEKIAVQLDRINDTLKGCR